MVWILKCTKCGNLRKLYVGYDLRNEEKLYVYCKRCGENTFHVVVEYREES